MRQSGSVKFFDITKGYGFITPDDRGADVFVHISTVQRSGIPVLEAGTRLSYEIEPDKRNRGPQAVELQLL